MLLVARARKIIHFSYIGNLSNRCFCLPRQTKSLIFRTLASSQIYAFACQGKRNHRFLSRLVGRWWGKCCIVVAGGGVVSRCLKRVVAVAVAVAGAGGAQADGSSAHVFAQGRKHQQQQQQQQQQQVARQTGRQRKCPPTESLKIQRILWICMLLEVAWPQNL